MRRWTQCTIELNPIFTEKEMHQARQAINLINRTHNQRKRECLAATLRAVEKRKNPGRANPGRVSVQGPEGAAPAAGMAAVAAFVRRLRRAQVLKEHLRDAGACTPHIVSKVSYTLGLM